MMTGRIPQHAHSALRHSALSHSVFGSRGWRCPHVGQVALVTRRAVPVGRTRRRDAQPVGNLPDGLGMVPERQRRHPERLFSQVVLGGEYLHRTESCGRWLRSTYQLLRTAENPAQGRLWLCRSGLKPTAKLQSRKSGRMSMKQYGIDGGGATVERWAREHLAAPADCPQH